MFIIGDIGNTETKICLTSYKGRILNKIILRTNLITNKYFNSKLKLLTKKNGNIKKILFCSVVPAIYRIVKKSLERKFKLKCREIKDLNFTNFIKVLVNKKQIGSDRLANAISVIDKQKNFIIVDFGTATTFDVIRNKKYYGGVIAPGIELSLSSLTNKATLIPKVKLSRTKKIVGKNTISSVNNGFFFGYVGLIENIVKMISIESKTKYKVIFTGGLANHFNKSLSFKPFVDRELTLKGLLKIIRKI